MKATRIVRGPKALVVAMAGAQVYYFNGKSWWPFMGHAQHVRRWRRLYDERSPEAKNYGVRAEDVARANWIQR